MLASIDLPDRLYRRLAKLAYETAGIALGETKRELVRARLIPRLEALGLHTFEEYYHVLSKHDTDGSELIQMLEAISTHKTDFFREHEQFIFLAETVLPTLANRAKARRDYRIRIWSAGCSSGEEPYTIAMVLRDTLDPSLPWDAKILATDISAKVLHFAHEGTYEESKVSAVPSRFRSACFATERTDNGAVFRMKPEVRQMVTFRRLNLINANFPFAGAFHVVFCRNVMIYFDRNTQEVLLGKFHRYLSPGGYLFVGQSESLDALRTPLRFVRPGVYVKRA